jgi:hypothetical protein
MVTGTEAGTSSGKMVIHTATQERPGRATSWGLAARLRFSDSTSTNPPRISKARPREMMPAALNGACREIA